MISPRASTDSAICVRYHNELSCRETNRPGKCRHVGVGSPPRRVETARSRWGRPRQGEGRSSDPSQWSRWQTGPGSRQSQGL